MSTTIDHPSSPSPAHLMMLGGSRNRYYIMFCICMFFISPKYRGHCNTLSYRCNNVCMLQELLQQIIAVVCLCCNKLLQRCAHVATTVALTVATHFTVDDATRLNGSYRVLLQQTYTPGCMNKEGKYKSQ